MTSFSGPLLVKAWQSETTAAQISEVGSARFTAGLSVSGNTILSKNVNVSGSAAFTGAVNFAAGAAFAAGVAVSGRQTNFGHPIMAVAYATVNGNLASAATQLFTLPTGAHITDVTYTLLNAFPSAASHASVVIGTTGAGKDNNYASFLISSALTNYQRAGYTGAGGGAVGTRVSGPNWHSLAVGNAPIHAKCTIVSGNLGSGGAQKGLVGVHYVRPV